MVDVIGATIDFTKSVRKHGYAFCDELDLSESRISIAMLMRIGEHVQVFRHAVWVRQDWPI